MGGGMKEIDSSVALDIDLGGADGDAGANWTIIRPDLGLFAIASPLGSLHLGATTALEALESEASARAKFSLDGDGEICEDFRKSILAADSAWTAMRAQNHELRGTGAVLAAVRVFASKAVVGHLGDCRVTKIRGHTISDRTRDHVVETRTLGSRRPGRAVVRGIGMESNPEVQIWEAMSGDTFVLAAGVHDLIDDERFIELVAGAKPGDAVARLTSAARTCNPKGHLVTVCFRLG